MSAWPVLLVLLVPLGFVARRAFLRPRDIFVRSLAGILIVVLGWALIWLLASPSNEAGFGFFAIWVVLTALALVFALVASTAAAVRYVVDRVSA